MHNKTHTTKEAARKHYDELVNAQTSGMYASRTYSTYWNVTLVEELDGTWTVTWRSSQGGW